MSQSPGARLRSPPDSQLPEIRSQQGSKSIYLGSERGLSGPYQKRGGRGFVGTEPAVGQEIPPVNQLLTEQLDQVGQLF